MSASKEGAAFFTESAPRLPYFDRDIGELLHDARFLAWGAYRLAEMGDIGEGNHDHYAVIALARMAHEAVERVLYAGGESVRKDQAGRPVAVEL